MADLDPNELFAFLAEHDEYPVSGQRLANEAQEDKASPELVQFFEALPTTMHNESEVVEHAIKPEKPPYDKSLNLGDHPVTYEEPTQLAEDKTQLRIADIKPSRH